MIFSIEGLEELKISVWDLLNGSSDKLCLISFGFFINLVKLWIARLSVKYDWITALLLFVKIFF